MTSDDLADARALLSALPLFAEVPPDELNATCLQLTPVHFAADADLVRARELGDCCYIVRSGQAKVVSDDLIDEETRIRFVGRGEVIGEIALFKNVLRVATVRAVTETEAFQLDRDTFLRLAEAAPIFRGRLNRRVDLAERVMFLRLASPFAQLSDDILTTLAQTLRPVHVQSGELVIRLGDPADCFYLVRSGRLEVWQGRRRVRQLASGDYFGETAILVPGPRDATIRAREDGELLALHRRAFGELVGTYPGLRNQLAEAMRSRDAILATDDAQTSVSREVVLPTLRHPFWLTLVLGLTLFIALDHVARASSRPELALSAMVVGALLGPTAYVAYLASTNILTRHPIRLAITFGIAGAAVPLAAQVESLVVPVGISVLTAFAVALVEEPIKVLGVLWLFPRREIRFQMDGVIYGAAAGMGFAALETLNYGLVNISSVSHMLSIIWLRGLLSPFMHGTWTAIVGAVIWSAKSSGASRWKWRILGGFGVAIALHTAWDWAPVSENLYYYYMGIGVIGLAILGVLVREAVAEQIRAVTNLNPPIEGRLMIAKHVEVVCGNCGQISPVGTRYCSRCGAALRA